MRRLAALAAAVLLAGCGELPTDEAPRSIAGVAVPTEAVSVDGAIEQPAPVVVYLVRERLLVGVHRVVPSPATLSARLAALAAGPTEREAGVGVRTALAGGLRVDRVVAGGSVAVVDLAPSATQTGTEEQILALAQIVWTLTAEPSITAVRFTVEGRPSSVPRADGSLADGPVDRSDYVALTRRRQAS